MNRQPLNLIIDRALWMIAVALIWILAIALTSPVAADVSPLIPSSPSPALKLRTPKSALPPGTKPSAFLVPSLVRRTTNNPVKFLAISRGPSPYDELVNVETILVGTTQLGASNVTWTVEQHGRTNQFTAPNTNNAHYWRMGFVIITNQI